MYNILVYYVWYYNSLLMLLIGALFKTYIYFLFYVYIITYKCIVFANIQDQEYTVCRVHKKSRERSL